MYNEIYQVEWKARIGWNFQRFTRPSSAMELMADLVRDGKECKIMHRNANGIWSTYCTAEEAKP